MDRRRFLVTSLAGAFAAPLAAEGQPTRSAENVYRIGFLIPISIEAPGSAPPSSTRIAAFTERMKELGWVEGRTFKMELRFSDRDEGKLRNAALELAGLPVNLI